MFTDSRHCLYRDGKCANCDKPMRHNLLLRLCAEGTGDLSPAIQRRHRLRTAEQLKEVRAICKACPHRTEGGGEYDAGLCKLKLAGCSKCNSIEKFLAFQESGAPCPDNPARFPATEVVDIGAE